MIMEGMWDPEVPQGEDSLCHREQDLILGRTQDTSRTKGNDSLEIRCHKASDRRR